MIAMLASLKDYLQRRRGLAPRVPPAMPPENPLKSGESLIRRKRLKVAIFAIMLGLVSAAISLPLPAEDGFRLLRAQLRMHPVPQDIAFIGIDDKTLNELGLPFPTRKEESELIDRLAAAGVDKIVFDRAQADPETPQTDAQFARTLERHKGKVWIGMMPDHKFGQSVNDEILPLKAFRDRAPMASMEAFSAPWALTVRIPTQVDLDGTVVPGIAAVLADYKGPSILFRVDSALAIDTVPAYSYIDVLRGRVGKDQLAGKSVIVGQAFTGSPDFYRHPIYGKTYGAYFHIVGAQTLREGTPVNLGWYPALLIATLAILAQALRPSRTAGSLLTIALLLPAATLLLDEANIDLDIMSALLAMGAAAIGFRRISKKYYNAEVNAMTTSALGLDKAGAEIDVYALKIANLAEMSEEWSAREIGEFVNTLITYVKGPGEAGDVAFERDVLVWFAPRMDAVSLERHADGLALMLKTAISYDWQSATSAPALGIDTNHDLPVGQRIKKAMQAADEAATRGARFIINDAAYLEARNNRLEVIRVLEKGLRERKIGVAYQPKVDLASGRITGAETLIRWRPEGGGAVNPQELVLAAEAIDRINELTMVVMETALTEGMEAIALDPDFKLAVNMSAKSLSDTHLLFDIMTMIGRIGFPTENLTLELTETAKLEDKLIAPQVAALKQRGIGLSIDDFGTGHSNLEYLEKLPSSELKIDKKFVQQMASSEESRAVVRATIEIAHSLGKVVVAEGVETQAVADSLRDMGCDQAQGFLFSRAIAMPELLVLMGRREERRRDHS
ncbi:MAG: EAL domain-containing protein [Porphyrobacter sp.]|nr:EAL domain-containing protein [Porphyrobacter sp.]